MNDAPWACPRCHTQWPNHARGVARFAPYGETRVVEGCQTCHIRDAVQPQLRADRIAAYGLSLGRAAGMTIERFVPLTGKEATAKRAVQIVADQWAAGGARSVWFWSPLKDPAEMRQFRGRACAVTGCGNGKTHLAYALARTAVDLNRSIKLASEDELLKELRASYDDEAARNESAILDDLNRAWLLVLDDVGTANVKSAAWYQDVFYGLVNARYLAGRPIVLTTNLLPTDLADRLGTRTMSRLGEMGQGFYLDGPDRRQMGVSLPEATLPAGGAE